MERKWTWNMALYVGCMERKDGTTMSIVNPATLIPALAGSATPQLDPRAFGPSTAHPFCSAQCPILSSQHISDTAVCSYQLAREAQPAMACCRIIAFSVRVKLTLKATLFRTQVGRHHHPLTSYLLPSKNLFQHETTWDVFLHRLSEVSLRWYISTERRLQSERSSMARFSSLGKRTQTRIPSLIENADKTLPSQHFPPLLTISNQPVQYTCNVTGLFENQT